jgi:hypothetical protein
LFGTVLTLLGSHALVGCLIPAYFTGDARKLWEDLENEGTKHMERNFALAKNLETLLAQRSQ